MKLIETLTIQQKLNMLNGSVVGIFPSMILPEDIFHSILEDLCLGYYTARSGEKTISVTYEKIIDITNMSDEITDSPETIIGKLIRGKYLDKWNRIYNVLIQNEYNPLENSKITERKTGNNKNTDTYNTVKGKQGNNSDTTTFDTNVEDDGKTGTKETTTRTTNDTEDVYGFNSVNSVHDTKGTESVNEIVTSKPEDNTTYNIQKKTGTESKVFGISESETHTGTDSKDIVINETFDRSGRNESGASLITEELDLRNKQIFFDIIYSDIDSIATLPIYI